MKSMLSFLVVHRCAKLLLLVLVLLLMRLGDVQAPDPEDASVSGDHDQGRKQHQKSTYYGVRRRRLQYRPGYFVAPPPEQRPEPAQEETEENDDWVSVNCSSDIQAFTSFLNVTLLQRLEHQQDLQSVQQQAAAKNHTTNATALHAHLEQHGHILESTLQTIYNALSVQQCDAYFRQIFNVSMLGLVHDDNVTPTRTAAAGPGGFNQLSNNNNTRETWTPPNTSTQALFQVSGVCRGCHRSEAGSFNLFDDAFRMVFDFFGNSTNSTNSTNATMTSSLLAAAIASDQCLCPKQQTASPAPTVNPQSQQDAIVNLLNLQLDDSPLGSSPSQNTPVPTTAPRLRPTYPGNTETQGFLGSIHLGSLQETTQTQVEEETVKPTFLPTMPPRLVDNTVILAPPTSAPNEKSNVSPDFWFNFFPADAEMVVTSRNSNNNNNDEPSSLSKSPQPTLDGTSNIVVTELPTVTSSPFYLSLLQEEEEEEEHTSNPTSLDDDDGLMEEMGTATSAPSSETDDANSPYPINSVVSFPGIQRPQLGNIPQMAPSPTPYTADQQQGDSTQSPTAPFRMPRPIPVWDNQVAAPPTQTTTTTTTTTVTTANIRGTSPPAGNSVSSASSSTWGSSGSVNALPESSDANGNQNAGSSTLNLRPPNRDPPKGSLPVFSLGNSNGSPSGGSTLEASTTTRPTIAPTLVPTVETSVTSTSGDELIDELLKIVEEEQGAAGDGDQYNPIILYEARTITPTVDATTTEEDDGELSIMLEEEQGVEDADEYNPIILYGARTPAPTVDVTTTEETDELLTMVEKEQEGEYNPVVLYKARTVTPTADSTTTEGDDELPKMVEKEQGVVDDNEYNPTILYEARTMTPTANATTADDDELSKMVQDVQSVEENDLYNPSILYGARTVTPTVDSTAEDDEDDDDDNYWPR